MILQLQHHATSIFCRIRVETYIFFLRGQGLRWGIFLILPRVLNQLNSTNLTAFNQLNPYICLGYHWLPEWFLYSWYPLDISAFARPLQRRVSTLRTTLTARQGARANKVLNKVVKSGQVMSSGNFLQNRGFSESQIAAGLLVDDRASRAEQEGRCSFRNLCCEWTVPWQAKHSQALLQVLQLKGAEWIPSVWSQVLRKMTSYTKIS